MEQIAVKLSIYFITIILGYVLKKIKIFSREDSSTVTRLILNVTLPATAIGAFANATRDMRLLLLVPLGYLTSVMPLIVSYLITKKKTTAERALYMCNGPSLNVSAFALPFLQLVVGPAALAGICLFDIGNVFVIHGTIIPVTQGKLHIGDSDNSAKAIIKKILKSVTFDVYALMLILFILNIQLPSYVNTVAASLASCNGFFVMFNLGLLLEFNLSVRDIKNVIGVVGLRLINGIIFSVLYWFVAPFDGDMKKVLVMASLAPIACTCPAFTKMCESDDAVSSLAVTITEIIAAAIFVVMIGFFAR